MVQTVQKFVKFPRVFEQGCLARCDARQGVVQTVQKTVKIPHAFLDMVVDRRQCRKNCGVSAVGAAPLCLCRRPSQQRRLFLRFMDYEQFWRGDLAASSFSVSCVQGSVAQGFEPRCAQAIILRTSYEVCLRMVQFLLFAVDGSGSRILLLGQGC